MPINFNLLNDDGSSSSNSDEDTTQQIPTPTPAKVIPSYEDLSSTRADEETVLQAVYDTDFKSVPGIWGCPKLQILVKPPDTEQCFCHLTLSVQLAKQYPYVPPNLELLSVQGLSQTEQNTLLHQLQEKARELAQSGTVMVIELVQLVEDYLIKHNEDPTVSAWEQMKAREKEQEAIQRAMEEHWMHTAVGGNANTEQVSPTNHEGMTSDSLMSSSVHRTSTVDLAPDIARELARQRQAIAAATQQRKKPTLMEAAVTVPNTNLLGESLQDEDDDEEDFDDFEAPSPPLDGNNSRYRTDFIELGILGRGGGGEVVKVRNRLDRRICKSSSLSQQRAEAGLILMSFGNTRC